MKKLLTIMNSGERNTTINNRSIQKQEERQGELVCLKTIISPSLMYAV